jgi:hypothetical protein
LIRFGVPDFRKRELLLKIFDINPSKAYFAYLAAKEAVSADFIEFTS